MSPKLHVPYIKNGDRVVGIKCNSKEEFLCKQYEAQTYYLCDDLV